MLVQEEVLLAQDQVLPNNKHIQDHKLDNQKHKLKTTFGEVDQQEETKHKHKLPNQTREALLPIPK
jgi:hypothetical protein